MGEAKQREKNAGLVKVIEASEQERVAMSLILTNLVRSKGPNQSRHRRLNQHFDLNGAAEAMADADAAAEEAADTKSKALNAFVQPKPTKISQFDSALVEYETTADVIEFFTKLHEENEIPGGWLIYSGNVIDRMLDKDYKAPSARVAEETKAVEQPEPPV